MLEPRAATSLTRLLHKQGRLAEGRELLADLQASFAEEDPGIPDLRDARDCLAALQSATLQVGQLVPEGSKAWNA